MRAWGRVLEHVSLDEGDPPVQVDPTSTLQSLVQPSPLMLFPSSQPRVNLLLSPQISTQRDVEKSR